MVNETDRTVLEFLAEHRVARAGHVAQLLGVTAETAARRLRALAKSEYVVRARLFADQPHYAAITRAGLAVIGSTLPEPALNVAEYRHDMGMAWVWLAARDGAFGELTAIHSERHMRSADGRAGEGEDRFGLRTIGWGQGGGPLTHYPDLLLETAGGHRIAVELELTQKSQARLEKIMRRYVGDRRIEGVVYLVDDARIAKRVQAAARRAGASDLVHVQSVRGTDQGERPARGRSRTPVRGPRAAHDRERRPELSR